MLQVPTYAYMFICAFIKTYFNGGVHEPNLQDRDISIFDVLGGFPVHAVPYIRWPGPASGVRKRRFPCTGARKSVPSRKPSS